MDDASGLTWGVLATAASAIEEARLAKSESAPEARLMTLEGRMDRSDIKGKGIAMAEYMTLDE
jgi:hypothetical protein